MGVCGPLCLSSKQVKQYYFIFLVTARICLVMCISEVRTCASQLFFVASIKHHIVKRIYWLMKLAVHDFITIYWLCLHFAHPALIVLPISTQTLCYSQLLLPGFKVHHTKAQIPFQFYFVTLRNTSYILLVIYII